MTKMARIPIYGKNIKNLLQNRKAYDLETWYAAWVLQYYQVCSDDDPILRKKGKTMDSSETIVVSDIEVGRCSYLNEYMDLYE